jgi:hypothetical protein
LFVSPGYAGISAPEKIECKNDERGYKQQMNQAVGDKAAIKPNQPK